eukprot:scaffold7554_cov22-Cyclotella_meneghiniana.AAC.1
MHSGDLRLSPSSCIHSTVSYLGSVWGGICGIHGVGSRFICLSDHPRNKCLRRSTQQILTTFRAPVDLTSVLVKTTLAWRMEMILISTTLCNHDRIEEASQ